MTEAVAGLRRPLFASGGDGRIPPLIQNRYETVNISFSAHDSARRVGLVAKIWYI